MGKQIYSNKFMLTETYKAVSSQLSFARVHSYFVKWAKLPINKECWQLGMPSNCVYIVVYGHAFQSKIRLCQVLALQFSLKR